MTDPKCNTLDHPDDAGTKECGKPAVYTVYSREYKKAADNVYSCEECADKWRKSGDDAQLFSLDEQKDLIWYMIPCCANEQRNFNGWCDSCGDPCL